MGQLDIELVLAPVDGSDESRAAVEYAIAIADRYGAAVHTVYVLGEEVVRAIESDAVDDTEVSTETGAFTRTVEDLATDAGVPVSSSVAYGFSTRSKLRHPGSVVLDTAEDVGADFLVIPREPVTGDPGEVLEKAAEYVLLYASQPVLSV